MKTIAIANQKGGCGKTTTAINLSAALAASNKNTLLIDLDPQAHASFALGVVDQPADHFVYNVLTDQPDKKRGLANCIVPIGHGLDILPSNIRLNNLEHELIDKPQASSVLYRLISGDDSTWDYIVVDCPPSLGFLTFNALRAADRVIIPMDMSPFSLMGVGKLLGMIDLLEKRLGHAPEVSALATLFDKRTTYSQWLMDEEIRNYFKDRILNTVIRHNVTLKRAVTKGVSVFEYDRRSTGAQDHAALAEEILGLDAAPRKAEPIVWSIPARDDEPFAAELPFRVPARDELFSDPEKEVVFTLEAPAAQEAYVVGEFNGWQINTQSRLQRSGSGSWEKRMKLAPGRYRYKFVIDGAWMMDTQNQKYEKNDFGAFDSLIEV